MGNRSRHIAGTDDLALLVDVDRDAIRAAQAAEVDPFSVGRFDEPY
jgi:hypothetical protein